MKKKRCFSQPEPAIMDQQVKSRLSPLSGGAITLLIDIVGRHPVANDRRSDSRIVSLKNKAWEDITNTFNASDVGETPRTAKQLKKIWDRLKSKIKKDYTSLKIDATDDGASPPARDPEVLKILRIISEDDDDVDDQGKDVESSAVQTLEATPPTFCGDSDGYGYTEMQTHGDSKTPQPPTTTQTTSHNGVAPNPSNTTTRTTPHNRFTPEKITSTQMLSTENQRKRRRVIHFPQGVTYMAAVQMQRKEHEKTMKCLELDLKLKTEALERQRIEHEKKIESLNLDIKIKTETLKKQKLDEEVSRLQLDALKKFDELANTVLEKLQ